MTKFSKMLYIHKNSYNFFSVRNWNLSHRSFSSFLDYLELVIRVFSIHLRFLISGEFSTLDWF